MSNNYEIAGRAVPLQQGNELTSRILPLFAPLIVSIISYIPGSVEVVSGTVTAPTPFYFLDHFLDFSLKRDNEESPHKNGLLGFRPLLGS